MAPPTPEIDPPLARREAAELFVLGFPLMLMDVVRRAHPLDARRFRRTPTGGHEALAPGLACEDPRFVRTSAFTALAAHPTRLVLPDMQGRYFTVTLVDSAGESFASLGARTTSGGAELTLIGPRWRGEPPPGSILRAPSDVVWAVSRIAAASPDDVVEVEALAARQRLAPVDGQAPPDEPPGLGAIEPPETSSTHQVASLSPQIYFHRLGRLLDAAPLAVQATIREPVEAKLATLSLLLRPVPVSDAIEQALIHGFKDGLATIREAARDVGGEGVFGWRPRLQAPILAEAGALAWSARAYVSLGAPLTEDLLPLTCSVDESGRGLSGRERYRLRFAAREQPPARAFWALSVDQALGRDPPLDRINDRSDLVVDEDGALEIFIQHEPPTGAPAVNWLRAPPGDFSLTADLHWPDASALDGGWRMPPVERLGSRVAHSGQNADTRPLKSRSPPPGASARTLVQPIWRSLLMRPLIPALIAAAALSAGLPAQGADPPKAAAKPAAAPATAAAPDVEPEAVQALERMSAYLRTLDAFEMTADTSMDLILDEGERIQVDGQTLYKVKRPNGFTIQTATTEPVRQVFYNGKQFTLFAPRMGYYATVPAPATIRETLDIARDKYGVVLPLEDLFRWSEPGSTRGEKLTSAFVVGPAKVDGADTDQYAFREGDLDWQIWIAKGDKPVPRKVVIVDRSDEARPAFTARMNWNTAPQIAASAFTFEPGPQAKQIRLGQVAQ